MRVGAATCAAAIVLCWLVSTPATAQRQSEYEVQQELRKDRFARSDWFIAFQGTYAFETNDTIDGIGEIDSTFGLQLQFGHRFNRWFAIDVSGMYVYQFRDRTGFNEYFAWGMHFNMRFYPLRGRIQPYLTVGPGFMNVIARQGSVSTNPFGFVPRFGAGLNIYGNTKFAVSIDAAYHLGVDSVENRDFATVGLGFVFH